MRDVRPSPPSPNLSALLSDDDRARVLELGRPRELAAGEELIRQGSPGDCLYVVEAGELVIARRLPGDEEEVLGRAGEGALVGELSVLDGHPRSATVRAATPARVRIIEAFTFDALCLEAGGPGYRVLRAVARSVHQRLEDMHGVVWDRVAKAGAERSAPPPPSILRRTEPDVRWALAELPALRGLSTHELAALEGQVDLVPIPRRERILGEELDRSVVHVVLRGALSPCLEGGPHRVELPVAGPGSFVGHEAVLAVPPMEVAFLARSPSLLARVPVPAFQAEAPTGARLLHALARDLAGALRKTTGLAMHLGMALG